MEEARSRAVSAAGAARLRAASARTASRAGRSRRVAAAAVCAMSGVPPRIVADYLARISRESNPFSILNVPRNASAEDIAKAYKQLVLVVHPDKCSDPRATAAFQKVKEAKEACLKPATQYRAPRPTTGGAGWAPPHMHV